MSDTIEEVLPSFGAAAYWEKEYKDTLASECRYDWVINFSQSELVLRGEIEKLRETKQALGSGKTVQKDIRDSDKEENPDILVLHLGSGNSRFPEEFARALSCSNQVVTDVSPYCMDEMHKSSTFFEDDDVCFLPADACDFWARCCQTYL